MKYYKGPFNTIFKEDEGEWSWFDWDWHGIDCGDNCDKVIAQYDLEKISKKEAEVLVNEKRNKPIL